MEALGAAASVIAVVQAAQACLDLGKLLVHKYDCYKKAGGRVKNLIIRIKGVWVRTEGQITLLQRVWHALNPDLQSFQEEALSELLLKLRKAIAKVDGLTGNPDDRTPPTNHNTAPMSRVQKIKYTVFETAIEGCIEDLEAWHRVFDPSWYLLGLVVDKSIDSHIGEQGRQPGQEDVVAVRKIRDHLHQRSFTDEQNQTLLLNDDAFSSERIGVPGSNTFVSKVLETNRTILLDSTAATAYSDILNLAGLLSASDPSTLGLLNCAGIRQTPGGPESYHYQLVFQVPPGMDEPVSLRHLLGKPSPSLDTKFELARSLSRSVVSVHSTDFVHKNIRPESIVVFERAGDTLPASFLLGFECFRALTAGTSLSGDMLWERNLYRHPNRQGLQPQDVYVMQHDVYSLGVCLLEIGLWTSFVMPAQFESPEGSPQPGPVLHIADFLVLHNKRKAAWEIKALLIDTAKRELSSKMGRTYTEVVISCLTCLDPKESNKFGFVEHPHDQDKVGVGVMFIEQVLTRLEGIVL